MPPRHAYWTILVDDQPTAFRAHDPEELLPTLNRLKEKHPSAVMKWFERGKLWESRDAAREAGLGQGERRWEGPRPDRSRRTARAPRHAIARGVRAANIAIRVRNTRTPRKRSGIASSRTFANVLIGARLQARPATRRNSRRLTAIRCERRLTSRVRAGRLPDLPAAQITEISAPVAVVGSEVDGSRRDRREVRAGSRRVLHVRNGRHRIEIEAGGKAASQLVEIGAIGHRATVSALAASGTIVLRGTATAVGMEGAILGLRPRQSPAQQALGAKPVGTGSKPWHQTRWHGLEEALGHQTRWHGLEEALGHQPGRGQREKVVGR